MSNRCPPEILDCIIDLLHNDPDTLEQCCLVSKSWVPRCQKHLFAFIQFRTPGDIEAWKKTFSGPPNSSPAYHTRTLTVNCPEVITVADAEEGSWIQAFSRVTRLQLDNSTTSLDWFFVPFRKLSPTLKSLYVSRLFLPLLQLFDLIHSLPLLEDLSLICAGTTNDNELDGPQAVVSPSTSPALTGTLGLLLSSGTVCIARKLLDLQNGLHFRKLKFWCKEEGLSSAVGLVEACSETLECLDIKFEAGGYTPRSSINLSKMTKLKDVVFRSGTVQSGWIVMILEAITVKHTDLQRISIHLPSFFATHDIVQREIYQANPPMQWFVLDRLLVKLWESRPIRVKMVYPRSQRLNTKESWAGYMFPEITRRGIADLVEE